MWMVRVGGFYELRAKNYFEGCSAMYVVLQGKADMDRADLVLAMKCFRFRVLRARDWRRICPERHIVL